MCFLQLCSEFNIHLLYYVLNFALPEYIKLLLFELSFPLDGDTFDPLEFDLALLTKLFYFFGLDSGLLYSFLDQLPVSLELFHAPFEQHGAALGFLNSSLYRMFGIQCWQH